MSIPPGGGPGFGPPHPSYRLPISDPEPVPGARVSAPPGPGPAPRRNRLGLLLQFVLQFIYIPFWVLILGAIVVALIMADSNADVSGGDSLFAIGPSAISWRRLVAEWTGRTEDWERITVPLLQKAFAGAEANGGWAPSALPPSGTRRVTAQLPVRHYRGLAPGYLEQLVEARGWSVDWAKSRVPQTELRFFRLMPPPAPPAALTGPGWEPLRLRLLVPLLTVPLRPRVRPLELRRDPNAYRTHLAEYLDKRCRAELARNAAKSYAAENGVILRRVQITAAHYRGLGAREVLRLAGERGWQLDTTYPARPEKSLRICRPDRVEAG